MTDAASPAPPARPKYDVFLSYSAKDRHVAMRILEYLESARLACWIAPRDIQPGDNWGSAIVRAIGQTGVMVVIYSANANESDHVLREIERAVDKKVKIVPVRIDDTKLSEDMEYFLSATHWMNAHEGPIDVHLDRLIELVRDLLGKTREHAAAGGEHEPAKVAPVTIPREVAESPAGGSASGRERVTMLVAAISAVVLLGVLILLLAGGNNEQDDGTGVNATVAASNPNRNANAADTPQVDTSDWETGGDLWGDDAPDAEPPAHPPERLTPDAATPAPAGAADGWIDLIPQINTTEHALSGSWSKGGDGVRVDATAVGPAVLALPYQPVGNYEYRLRFTRHAGEDSLAQIFTLGQGRANFEMDCWGERLGGVQQIDDVDVRGNATRLNNINLSTDATYTMSLRVTGSSFVGRVAGPDIDETVRYDSPSNGDELSAPPIWGIDDSLRLGIGVYNSIFVIHEIAVRPLP